MKKVLALVLAIITVLTLSVIPFTASAAEGKDPTFTADKNLIVGQTEASKGYINGTAYFAATSNAKYSYLSDKDYAGKLYTFTAENPGVQTDYSGTGECFTLGIAATPRCIDFSRDGTAEQKYKAAAFIHVSDTKVKAKSFLIAVPGPLSVLAPLRPDGFTILAGDAAYDVTGTATAETIAYNKAHFKTALVASKLVEENKYKDSADGKFSYYEVNFDNEIELTDLAIFFTTEDYATIKANYADCKINQVMFYFTEIALFADAIPAAEQTEAKTEEQKPADNTGDTSMLLGMILVGAVAFTASVAVIKKKEENV